MKRERVYHLSLSISCPLREASVRLRLWIRGARFQRTLPTYRLGRFAMLPLKAIAMRLTNKLHSTMWNL
jgi:hypothetical protein